MDRDMRLRKVCPQCNTVVHVKRSCCGCGHVFTLKRKVQVSADKSMGKAVKRRRALETVEDGRVYFTERNGTERNGTQGYFTERTSVIAERLI